VRLPLARFLVLTVLLVHTWVLSSATSAIHTASHAESNPSKAAEFWFNWSPSTSTR
jgi:hypothetical protein